MLSAARVRPSALASPRYAHRTHPVRIPYCIIDSPNHILALQFFGLYLLAVSLELLVAYEH